MKATGIVRRVDDLGRVVIPKEIRQQFGIKEGTPLEVFVDNDSITFKKYDFTDNVKDQTKQLMKSIHEIEADYGSTDKISDIKSHLSEIMKLLKDVV